MERMGDILAKNASRRRAASGPLSPATASASAAATKPETTPSAPAAPGRAAPSGRIQRATSTTPLVRRVTPRPRATPVVPGVARATSRPAQTAATSRYRATHDAQPQPPAAPQASADTLDGIIAEVMAADEALLGGLEAAQRTSLQQLLRTWLRTLEGGVARLPASPA